MLALSLIAAGLTGTSAFILAERQQSDSSEDTYDNVCMPTNATGYPDLTAPCNSWSRTQQLCVYGEQIRGIVDAAGLNDYDQVSDGSMKEHHFEYQRDCICQSQQFDQMRGCMACNDVVGGDSGAIVPSSAINSFSSSYCAVDTTPTVGYISAMNSVLASAGEATDLPTASSSSHKSLGSKTDVSLYYTPAATGASAWDVGLPTGISATFSSLRTSEGQIVPTASAREADTKTKATTSESGDAQTQTDDVTSESTSTVSEGRAVETGGIGRGMVAGVLGAAAQIAAL